MEEKEPKQIILTKKGTPVKRPDLIGNKHGVGNKGGRPIKFSPRTLKEKSREYVQAQSLKEKPITLTGLAIHLDIDRETLFNYSKKDEYLDVIKAFRLRCEDYIVSNLLEGKTPSHAGSFLLKNHYNYVDKTEVKTDISGSFSLTGILNNLDDKEREQLELEEPEDDIEQ